MLLDYEPICIYCLLLSKPRPLCVLWFLSFTFYGENGMLQFLYIFSGDYKKFKIFIYYKNSINFLSLT